MNNLLYKKSIKRPLTEKGPILFEDFSRRLSEIEEAYPSVEVGHVDDLRKAFRRLLEYYNLELSNGSFATLKNTIKPVYKLAFDFGVIRIALGEVKTNLTNTPGDVYFKPRRFLCIRNIFCDAKDSDRVIQKRCAQALADLLNENINSQELLQQLGKKK